MMPLLVAAMSLSASEAPPPFVAHDYGQLPSSQPCALLRRR